MSTLTFLRRHPLLARAPEQALTRLAAASTTRIVDKGATVVRAGAPPTTVFVIVAGALELIRKDRGALILHGVVDAPSVFGDATWAARVPWPVTGKAAAPTSLVAVPGPAFDAFVDESPQVTVALYRATCVRLAGQIQARLFTTRLSTEAKVAVIVGRLSARAKAAGRDGFVKVSPVKLAAALGVDRKTVFRNLKALHEAGALERDGERVRATGPLLDDAPPIVRALE